MSKQKADNSYNTNLASEFLMMSLLSRTGKNAYLSLGNKKGVDIIVTSSKGNYALLEVKGVNGKRNWFVGNKGILRSAENLFYALVDFRSQIKDVNQPANYYIIPSVKLRKISEYKVSKNIQKTVYLSHKHIRENYENYLNTFKWLEEYLKKN